MPTQTTYSIVLSCDITEPAEFKAWLTEQGHVVTIGKTTRSTLNGPYSSEESEEIINRLWEEFCEQVK